MRSTTLGNLLLSFSIVFAFVGVILSNLSWLAVSVAFTGAYVYAYLKFVAELEATSLRIDRTIPEEIHFATEPLDVNVEVLNENPMPVKAAFEDLVPQDCSLHSGSARVTMTLPPRSVLKMAYSITPPRRGILSIPGMKLERTDTFGLFEEDQLIEHGSVINVHTERGSFDTARKMIGKEHLEFSGMGRNPAVVLREFEFDGIREYMPGDRARDIHWKLLPKLGKLMTKTYRREGSVNTTIFVDCGRSMRLEAYKLAKVDHALDLSMQLSNVLLSSFHPTGVATFDEMRVIDKVLPALGRHQFERIVKLLEDVPNSVRLTGTENSGTRRSTANAPPMTKWTNKGMGDEGKEFLSALDKLYASGARKRLGIGLEGGIKEILARSKGQEQLFIIISDLISSRDAVLAGAKVCKSTGNRMLVIHTYDDWYRSPGTALDVQEIEHLYSKFNESIGMEAAFRGLGTRYLRIGPADTASRIARAIRRGKP